MKKEIFEKIEKKLGKGENTGESNFERKGRIFVSIGIGVVSTIMFLTICFWALTIESLTIGAIRLLLFDYFVLGLGACLISAISAIRTNNPNPKIKEIFKKLYISVSAIIMLIINVVAVFPVIGLIFVTISLLLIYLIIIFIIK